MAYESDGPGAYDVFLSFRGEDTRNNFTSHLYTALDQKGINTFRDDEELKRGEEISPALLKAIAESRISIIVFSENYASSSWCLDELSKIYECKENKKQKVLPVFYKVDPSDVRRQINNFGKAFAELEVKVKNDLKMQKWRKALHETANLSGWHLQTNENESEFVQRIVDMVSRTLVNRMHLNVAKYPVGIESRVLDVNLLLSIGLDDRRMVGIFGIGGIGKTTIAKEIYNSIADQFEGSCFLTNVREKSKGEDALVQLQERMLFEILGVASLKLHSADKGICVIKRRLCRKKVLLVLDDVDDSNQLDALVGSCDWFGLGSRIIITTRDQGLLARHDVDLKYKVKELDFHEALQLFSCHALKGKKLVDDNVKLAERVIYYAGGLPLALTVLGSELCGKNIRHWKSALDKYERMPSKSIQDILKVSYDGLDDNVQYIFLDIACFFKGESVDYVTKIVGNCGFSTDHDIGILVDKCLITIEYGGKLGMHDLVQDMGREIVRKDSPGDPGKRSRLWFHEDVIHVLEENRGTDTVEGILVDLPKKDQDTVRLNSEFFQKMTRLRLFINRNAKISGRINYLSNELRLLDWPKYPLESLPSNFHPKKLVVLRMHNCSIKQLNGFENLRYMTSMDFSNSKSLTKIPDFSGIPNLEKLILFGCENLVEVHNSVGFLEKLVFLTLFKCSNLRSFPRSLKLRSLEMLILSGCSRLDNFPEIEVKMERIILVSFVCTPIKELPSSIENLTGLNVLDLRGCKNLMCLPSNIHQLKHLRSLYLGDYKGYNKFLKVVDKDNRQSMPSNIVSTKESKIPSSAEFLSLQSPTKSSISNDSCSSIVFPTLQNLVLRNSISDSNLFSTLNCFSTLEFLDLSKSNLVSIPACINRFVGLKFLILSDCKQLQEILLLPPNIETLVAGGCISLERFSLVSSPMRFSRLRWINLSGCHKLIGNIENAMRNHLLGEVCGSNHEITIIYPGNKIPDWFSRRQEPSNPNECHMDIKEPSDLDGEILGMVVGAVVKVNDGAALPPNTTFYYPVQTKDKPDFMNYYHNVDLSSSDNVWMHYVPECELKREYWRVEFSIFRQFPISIRSCGVHLVHQYTNPPQDQDDSLDVPNEDVGNLVITKRRRDDNLESIPYPQQKIRYDDKAQEIMNQYTNPPREDDGVDLSLDDYDDDDLSLDGYDDDDDDDNLESIPYPQQKIRRPTIRVVIGSTLGNPNDDWICFDHLKSFYFLINGKKFIVKDSKF